MTLDDLALEEAKAAYGVEITIDDTGETTMTNHDLEIAINNLSESDAIRFADWCDALSVESTGEPIDDDGKPRTPYQRAHRAADRFVCRRGKAGERVLAKFLVLPTSYDVVMTASRERAIARTELSAWFARNTRRLQRERETTRA